MRTIRAWLSRLGNIFDKKRRERELSEELESHLAFHIDENVRCGMSPEEARRQALIKLGGLDQTKEAYRDRRGVPWLEHWFRDARISARVLAKDPRFSILAILGLGLGLGVSTAIFALINASATVGDRAAVQDPASYVGLYGSINGRVGYSLPYADYRYYQAHAASFRLINAESGRFGFVLGASPASNAHTEAEDVQGRFESENFLSVLGLQPALGRIYSKEEAVAGSRVAVLNFRFWQNYFDGDQGILGKTIVLNRQVFTIIGVAPQSFGSADLSDVYLPLELEPALSTQDLVHDPASQWLHLDARLNAGVALRQAQAELSVLWAEVVQSKPERLQQGREGIALSPGGDNPDKHKELVALAAAVVTLVSMILLVACTNLANILLARGIARRREIGVRLSLGATRARLVSLLMTESVILALCGAGVGLLFSHWLASALFGLLGAPTGFVLQVDPREFIYALALSIASAVSFGLGPALVATKSDLSQALHSEGRSGGRGSNPHKFWSARNALVVVPLAISFMLLLGAGATLRGIQQGYFQGPAFETSRLTAVRLELNAQGYNESRTREFQETLRQRIATIPGVTSVAFASNVPLGNSLASLPLVTAGSDSETGDSSARTDYNVISPDFFPAIGIAIRHGRNFAAADQAGAPPVAIVSQSLASRYWGNQEPLGKQIRLGNGTGPYFDVIGVAPDFENPNGPLNAVRPTVYVPYGQEKMLLSGIQTETPPYQMQFLIRTSGDPTGLKLAVRQEIQARDSALVTHIQTIGEMLNTMMGPFLQVTALLSALGGLALVMASVGIYAIIAYTVSQQTREIGIRVALGATRRDILSMVMHRTVVLITWSLSLGFAGALATDRIFSSALANFTRLDPIVCITASVLPAVVALLATYIPARKALRVDPVAAIRCE